MKSSTNAYSMAQKSVSIKQNELEARALIKTASLLNLIRESWEEKQNELDDALTMNRKLWTILTSNINDADNPLPVEIKQNVANLAYFIFKRTIDIMAAPRPESLQILININMNIARGLLETITNPEEEIKNQEDNPHSETPPTGGFNQTA